MVFGGQVTFSTPPQKILDPRIRTRLGRVTNRRLLFFFGAPKNRRFPAPKTKNRLFRRAPKEQRPIYSGIINGRGFLPDTAAVVLFVPSATVKTTGADMVFL